MRIQINGARIIDPASGMDQQAGYFIDDGKIVAIGDMPREFVAEQMIDANGLIAAPGLVDISTSLREPGLWPQRHTIATETRAGAAGGVTSVCCTPQTKPILDTSAVVEFILDKARDEGSCKVYPLGAFSQGLAGEQLAELVTLRDAGCIAFTNGLVPFASNCILGRALEYAATFDLTVIFQPQDASH